MKIILFLIFFSSSFVYSNDCPGFVTEKKESNGIFSGKCDSSGNKLWGEIYYSGDFDGDYYIGYFKDGLRESGTYHWSEGDFLKGLEFKSENQKNGIKYDFVGEWHKEGGSIHYGFFLNANPNGYGFFRDDENESRSFEAGIYKTIDGEYGLNGYGVRVFNGNWYWGYWENNKVIGDYYETDEEFENISKYRMNKNGNSSGPFELSLNDNDRLEKIVTFITEHSDEYDKYEDYIYDRVEQYNEEIKEYNAFVNNGGNTVNAFDESLVRSIQELLSELGYSPGKIDGLLGAKTVAAIKAFELEINKDQLTGEPSEELLIALQLAIRSSKMQTASDASISIEPSVISTGTGFYVNSKNIVSNHHVVDECKYVTDINDNKLNIIVSDEVNDISLLNGPKTVSFLPISEDAPKLGEKIYVSGFPYNADLRSFMITSGNVSSLSGLGKNFSEFSHTAPSQPGNSGGPIVNAYGSVVGILVSGVEGSALLEVDEKTGNVSGSIPQNINFGIQNTVLKSLLLDNDIEATLRKDPFFTKSEKNIAEITKRSSVLIKCFGYYED